MLETEDDPVDVTMCKYICSEGELINVAGNPPEGFYCPPVGGNCSEEGDIVFLPAVEIPQDPPGLTANSGIYSYNRTTKSLYFRGGGSCGKGKHFKSVITLKELAKIDANASELVKSMHKNKKIESFSVVLKAQKIEKA